MLCLYRTTIIINSMYKEYIPRFVYRIALMAEMTGVELELPVHGTSLLDPAPDPDRSIFFELESVWYHRKPDGSVVAREQSWTGVRQGAHKLVGVPGSQMFLFNIHNDPRERTDLLQGDDPPVETEQRLTWLLREQRADMLATRAFYDAGGRADVDEVQLERLRSLGYVD